MSTAQPGGLAPSATRQLNVERFMQYYRHALSAAVEAHPEEYSFDITNLDTVCARMQAAFVKGSYNHDGRAIKATCRALGIKHAYYSMENFFNGHTQGATK